MNKRRLITALIEDWFLLGNCIHGKIYADAEKRWKDGHEVQLSRLVPPKQEIGVGKIIRTNNSVYILGKGA